MYTQDQVTNIFDGNIWAYLINKRQGGTNNAKGNIYENHFATYQLAQFSRYIIEEQIEIKFYSQIWAFVDDLIIDYLDTRIHYQFKNWTSSLSWGDKNRQNSLCFDFYNQNELNKETSSKITHLCLVVSEHKNEKKLSENIPADIKEFTDVLYFPYVLNINELLGKVPFFKEAINYLSAFEEPEPDKVECVITVLLGAWDSIDKSEVSLKCVLEKAKQCSPSYIRSLNINVEINPNFKNIMEKIPDFSYTISKGFFHWEHAGVDSGTIPYDIETENFDKLQNRIIQEQPSCFDELEAFL